LQWLASVAYASDSGMLLYRFIFMCAVSDEWLLVNKDYGKIKDAVISGTRPPLDAITGPADLVSSLRSWIDRCWDKTPDLRPSFNGKLSPCFCLKVASLFWQPARFVLFVYL